MNLAVTGIGMVTSLGYGCTGSCAAIRAGLSRARFLPGTQVSEGEGKAARVRGHPTTAFAEGFFQAGAWVRLASGALEDFQYKESMADVSPEFWRRTGLIALLPLLDPGRFMWAIHRAQDALTTFFTEPLRAVTKLPIPSPFVQAVAMGHSGLGEALHRAEKFMSSRHLDRVIVIGADSYLDGLSLQWLSQHKRLKSGDRPTGMQPGQAGACLLVELDAAARKRQAPSSGYIAAVAVKNSSEHPSPVAKLGHLLAQAVTEVLDVGGVTHPFQGELVLDLNGEEWKAHAWGHAQVLLTRRIHFAACRSLVPCESLGEIGAASSVLGAGLALSGFQDQETAFKESLVCCLSDAGHVAAVLLRNAGSRPTSVSWVRS